MNELSKASRDAIEAAQQGEQYATILATVAAVQAAQQQTPACGCQHSHQAPARPRRSTGQLLAITGAVCACGTVAVGMFLAIAITAMALGLSGVVVLFLVRELRKGR